jgi:hypothetical protein
MVDAIELNRWIKVYVQIVIYYYFTSDHDLYDVLWIVYLVLEDMGEVKSLVVKLFRVVQVSSTRYFYFQYIYDARLLFWLYSVLVKCDQQPQGTHLCGY